ncbi:hypothetical protein ACFX2K_032456 [Malus domestica]
MGPRRSTRLNVILGGAAPPPQGSTTGPTVVATTIATCGEVHGVTTTTARAVPPKQAQREPNVLPSRAQAEHSRASHT